MTLPINITLPLDASSITADDPQALYNYMKKLVFALSSQLQQANKSANGSTFEFTSTGNPTYPFIQGTATAGVGTYTAVTIVTTRRINLMTFCWFDITWSAHTGTGDVLVTVPYFAQFTPGFPFVAVIESDNNTFTAGYTYLTGNLTPNTNTIAINQNGSAVPLLALPLAAAGHLRGSIFYAGQQGQ